MSNFRLVLVMVLTMAMMGCISHTPAPPKPVPTAVFELRFDRLPDGVIKSPEFFNRALADFQSNIADEVTSKETIRQVLHDLNLAENGLKTDGSSTDESMARNNTQVESWRRSLTAMPTRPNSNVVRVQVTCTWPIRSVAVKFVNKLVDVCVKNTNDAIKRRLESDQLFAEQSLKSAQDRRNQSYLQLSMMQDQFPLEEYGFENQPELKHRVDRLQGDLEDLKEQLAAHKEQYRKVDIELRALPANSDAEIARRKVQIDNLATAIIEDEQFINRTSSLVALLDRFYRDFNSIRNRYESIQRDLAEQKEAALAWDNNLRDLHAAFRLHLRGRGIICVKVEGADDL